MNKRKVFLSVVAAVLVAIITFCTFGNGKTVLAADDDKEYVFKNAASTDSFVRTDSGSLEAYDELVYCMEIDRTRAQHTSAHACRIQATPLMLRVSSWSSLWI